MSTLLGKTPRLRLSRYGRSWDLSGMMSPDIEDINIYGIKSQFKRVWVWVNPNYCQGTMIPFGKKPTNPKVNKTVSFEDSEASPTKATKKNNKTSDLNQASTPTYTIKPNIDLDSYSLLEVPNPDYEPSLRRITGLRLTWLTAQEIENMAVVDVSASKQNGPGSIYDPCFGTITNHEKCPICSQSWRDCPGHTGVIKLPYPIPHPVCLKRLADVLSCFCEYCHRLILTWKQMRTLGILEYHHENRFKAFLDMAKRVLRCSHCKQPHGKYIVADDKFSKCYRKKAEVKMPLTYEEVVAVIFNIRDQEMRLLGFKDPLCHPRHMIISALCVLPSSARPFVKSGTGQLMHDDLTCKYNDVVKVTTKLKDAGLKEKQKNDLMDTLFFNVKTLFDNSKSKAKDSGGRRVLRALKQRISGKSGMVRNNIQGKRTVESARSVITPDPDLHVCEVGMPRELAEKLMYPERVTAHNLASCQALLDSGQVLRIIDGNVNKDARYSCWTPGFKLLYGDIVIRNGRRLLPHTLPPEVPFSIQVGDSVLRIDETEQSDGSVVRKGRIIKNVKPPERKNFKLRPGQIIERKLKDGDYGIFNRQPSLHELSLRAKRIKIHDKKTFQMELSSTQGYGADFDGDEMNLFTACSENSRAEMQELMSPSAQFIAGADSRPSLILKHDNAVAGYIYTVGRVPVPEHIFNDACCLLGENLTNNRSGSWSVERIGSKIAHIRRVHRWIGMLQTEVEKLRLEQTQRANLLNTRLEEARNLLGELKSKYALAAADGREDEANSFKRSYDLVRAQIRGLKAELDLQQVPDQEGLEQITSDNLLYCGHGLFSVLLPDNFEFKYETKLSPDKLPVRITRGVIVSGTFNNSALQHLIHQLFIDYGPDFGCDFITHWQRITNLLLNRDGFSVGIGDCIPTSTHIIQSELEKAFLQAREVETGPLDSAQKDQRLLGILNGATDIGERIIREGVSPENNFIRMIVSGAKGKMFNYVNSVSAVGQQNLSGKRAPRDVGGRSLPCYPAPDTVVEESQLSEFEQLSRRYQAGGFITNSFYSGLTSQEFFFLAMGGREGLIDTSVKTARCGYLSKRMLKAMEDVKIGYNQTVVNSKGSLIQLAYGEDNFNASELIPVGKHGLSCIDVAHLADILNRDIEWNEHCQRNESK